MKRAPFVAGATVLGLVGIMTFHSQSSTSTVLAAPKPQAPPQGRAAPMTSTTTATPAVQPSPNSNSTSTSTSTVPSAPAIRTAVGPNEQYGYGSFAVKVTVTGTKITDVSTQGLQTAEQYSQQLADQVIPMLRSEVLHAQSTRINGISGATYTAEAYVTSLQAALNRLHFA